eukprot:gene3027-5037_t
MLFELLLSLFISYVIYAIVSSYDKIPSYVGPKTQSKPKPKPFFRNPFVRRLEIEKCKITSEEKQLTVGKKLKFKISLIANDGTEWKEPTKFSVTIEGVTEIIPEITDDNFILFEARKSGLYHIFLNYDGYIKKKKIEISPGEIEPKFSEIKGIDKLPFYGEKEFTISTFDRFHNKRKKGGNSNKFQIELMSMNQTNDFQKIVEDEDNGRYKAFFSIQTIGIHQLEISYDDELIKKFELVVLKDELKSSIEEKIGNFEVENNKEKMYLKVSPTQISLIKYKFYIFPVKLFVFKLRNVNVKINQETTEMTLNDSEFQEFIIKSKDFVIIYGLIKYFLHSKVGASFDEKFMFFKNQISSSYDSNYYQDLFLKIDRQDLFNSAYGLLNKMPTDHWKKKWVIQFKNEPGIDAGGLFKEFIQLFSTELFQNNELFSPNEKQKLSFNPKNQNYDLFEFAGKFFGKCLYEQILIGVPFSHVFFKHLIGIPFNYKDFEMEDPTLFTTKIKFILESDMDDPDTRELLDDLNFTEEEYSTNNKVKIVELKKHGKNTLVTNKNKREYLFLLTKYKFVTIVQKQVESFMKGLQSMVHLDWLNIFDENELEYLICGLPEISVEDWKNNVDYSSISSTIKKWFWIAIDNLNQEERARLLQFITSTTQVPIGGFKNFTPKIKLVKKISGSSDSLPFSHTCSNTIELPNYSSYEKLLESITIALNYGNEGFGFA